MKIIAKCLASLSLPYQVHEKDYHIPLNFQMSDNRPFSHYKFPCSLRALGMTKSIRTGASGSKCTPCIWTSESVITIKYRLFLAFSIVNC